VPLIAYGGAGGLHAAGLMARTRPAVRLPATSSRRILGTRARARGGVRRVLESSARDARTPAAPRIAATRQENAANRHGGVSSGRAWPGRRVVRYRGQGGLAAPTADQPGRPTLRGRTRTALRFHDGGSARSGAGDGARRNPQPEPAAGQIYAFLGRRDPPPGPAVGGSLRVLQRAQVDAPVHGASGGSRRRLRPLWCRADTWQAECRFGLSLRRLS
jgi:hypothetical protein